MKKIKNFLSFFSYCSKFLLVIITIIFTICTFCSPVFADEVGYDCDACGSVHEYDNLNGIAETVFKWGITIYDTRELTSAVGNTLMLHTNYSAIWDIAVNIYNVMKVAGVGFATIYCLLFVIDKVQSEQFNAEHFFKAFLKYGISLAVISNGTYLLQYVMFMSDKFFESLGTVTGSGVATDQICSLYTECESCTGVFLLGTLKAIGLMFQYLIPYLCVFIAKILILVNSYSRALEFFVRAAFAPIGLSGLASGENNQQSMRYLKKFAAVGLQGALILVVVLCYSSLLSAVQTGIDGFFSGMGAQVQYIIVSFAMIGLLSKTQSWANDVLNV